MVVIAMWGGLADFAVAALLGHTRQPGALKHFNKYDSQQDKYVYYLLLRMLFI